MRYEAARAYLIETASMWRPGADAVLRARMLRAKTYVTQESARIAADLFALLRRPALHADRARRAAPRGHVRGYGAATPPCRSRSISSSTASRSARSTSRDARAPRLAQPPVSIAVTPSTRPSASSAPLSGRYPSVIGTASTTRR